MIEWFFAHMSWLSYVERLLKWLPPLYSRIKLRNKITASFTPQDIFETAASVPVGEQEHIYQRYFGHRVHWCVLLKHVESGPHGKNMLNLQFGFTETGIDICKVRCTVKSGRYPEVDNFKGSRPVLLFGRVEAIEDKVITLSKPELTFTSWT